MNEAFFPQGQGSIILLLPPSPPPQKKEKKQGKDEKERKRRKEAKKGKKGEKRKKRNYILPCSRNPTRSVLNYPDPGGFKINLFKNKKH